MEMEGINLHQKINNAIAILDRMKFQGYHEITVLGPAVGMAMKELILLDQEIAEAELKTRNAEEKEEAQ